MSLEIIIGLLLLTALVFAWSTEKKRRKASELESDVTKRRVELNEIERKLAEAEAAYHASLAALGGTPIPPHMLELVGNPEAATAGDPRGVPSPVIDPIGERARYERPGFGDEAHPGGEGEAQAPR